MKKILIISGLLLIPISTSALTLTSDLSVDFLQIATGATLDTDGFDVTVGGGTGATLIYGFLDATHENDDSTLFTQISEGFITSGVGDVVFTGTGELLLTGSGSDVDDPYTLTVSGTLVDLTLDDGLIGYWRLDDGTGSTIARDSSRFGNDGIFQDTDDDMDWVAMPSEIENHTGNFFNPLVLRFDGASDDYVDLGSNITLPSGEPFTLAIWAYAKTLPGRYVLSVGGAVTNQGPHLGSHSSNNWRFAIWGDGVIDNNTSHGTNAWNHLAGTYDGTNGRLYVNGALVGGPTSFTFTGTDGTARIGALNNRGATWSGFLDDARIYDRALSTSEVASLANGNQYSGSGVYAMGSALAVSGDLAMYDSTLSSGNAYGITVSGSWIGHGRLNSTGTVTLDGTSQTISGNTVFFNLTKTVTSADTLFFDFQGRQSVSGALTLQGAASNLLSLRSTLTGSASNLLLDGSSGTQTIDHLDVQDSDASGGLELECLIGTEGCSDSGNNTNWNFAAAAAPTIVGSVYSDEGITSIGAGKLVSISMNGGAASGSGTTDAGGEFIATMTGVTLTGGTILTLFLDGETEDAVTVSFGSGSSMTGVHLYQDRLILRSNTGSATTGNASPLTNSDLTIADNSGDSDITAIFHVDSSTELQLHADKELYVWAGSLFTPGGRVRSHDVEVQGTLTMGTNGLVASGSLVVEGAMTTSTGVLLSSSDNSETLSGATVSFNNLTIDNGLVGYWRLDDGTGSTVARDSSRFGNDGTLQDTNNTMDWVAMPSETSHTGSFFNPYALSFDGVNDFVDISTNSNALLNNEYTVSAWIKPPSLETNGRILSIGEAIPGNNSYTLQVSNGRIVTFRYSGGYVEAGEDFGDTFSAGTWNFAAGTYDGANLRAYLNGVEQDSQVATGNIGYAISGSSRIGRRESGAESFLGLIDDARVYNRALTASEIAFLAVGNQSTGSGVYVLGSALNVSGDLGIYAGILDVSANDFPVTVSGAWINHGGFTKRSGVVVLDGTAQTISGNTVFFNLTKTVTSADTLFFDFQGRQSVSGALTLQGAASNLLSLRSTLTGSASNLLLDGSSGTQTIDHLDVQDSDASGGAELECLIGTEGCSDSGNNTNWNFAAAAAPTIVGSVYSDEGTTSIGAGKLVSISANGGAASGSGTTDAGGEFTAVMTGVTLTGGTILTLYLDGETEDAVTVSFGSGSSMTGVHLYQDRLILRSNTGSATTGNASPLTNSDLTIADNSGDSDITAIFHVDSSTELQLHADKELYVWAGSTFTPGGRVRSHDVDIRGTLTMGTNGLVASGSLVVEGAMTTSTGVLLSSSDNSETLSGATVSFNNLTIDNGLIGYWRLDDGTGSTVARDSSRFGNHGTVNGFDTGTGWVAFTSGNTHTGSFFNPYALDFDGIDDLITVSDDPSLGIDKNLTVSVWIKMEQVKESDILEKGGVDGYVFWLDSGSSQLRWGIQGFTPFADGDLPVLNDWMHVVGVKEGTSLRLYYNGVLNATATNSQTIDPTGDLLIGDGLDGNWNGSIDDVRVYNRALTGSEIASLAAGNQYSGSGVYVLGSALSVSGDLGIYAGTLDVSTNDFAVTVSGAWINHGGFTKQAGTVTLDGDNQTMSGNTVFENLTKIETATDTLFFDFQGRQSVSGALTLQGAASNLLSLRSTLSGSASNILLDGSAGTQTIDHLDVQDSDASGGTELECLISTEGCSDSGNNTNWNFGAAAAGPGDAGFMWFPMFGL